MYYLRLICTIVYTMNCKITHSLTKNISKPSVNLEEIEVKCVGKKESVIGFKELNYVNAF